MKQEFVIFTALALSACSATPDEAFNAMCSEQKQAGYPIKGQEQLCHSGGWLTQAQKIQIVRAWNELKAARQHEKDLDADTN